MDVAAGRCKRLAVTMPPRHGKSELVSKAFPAWYLGTFPDRRIILASYEADFAAGWGRRARTLLEEYGPDLWGVDVDKRSSAADRWDIAEHAGGMITAGVGGPITGRGAHVLVIDDPIKNAEEAASQTLRDKIHEWYLSTAYTRLESDPEGAIIIVMTRWNEDDLLGRELAGGEDWQVLNFCAIAEEGDNLGRQRGEALWPERFPKERLDRIAAKIGPYWWNALYQQRPTAPEGGIIKRDWIQFYDPPFWPPQIDQWVQSWDLAFKDAKSNSYVVGTVWARAKADFYLIDLIREHLSFPATIDAIKLWHGLYPQALTKLIEDKANGPAVIQTLQHEIPGLIPVAPRGSKDARLSAIAPVFHSGNVYIPRTKPWTQGYVAELCNFPNAPNDDQVDSTSQALDWMTGEGASEGIHVYGLNDLLNPEDRESHWLNEDAWVSV